MQSKKTSIITKVIVAAILLIFIITFTAYNYIDFLIINQETEKIETVKQILTSGEWRMGDAALNFTATEYTAVSISSIDGKEEKITYAYEVTDVIAENGVYKIKWIGTDSEGNSSDITDIKIVVKGSKGTSYYLYSSSLPFMKVYKKTFDIVVTLPLAPIIP